MSKYEMAIKKVKYCFVKKRFLFSVHIVNDNLSLSIHLPRNKDYIRIHLTFRCYNVTSFKKVMWFFSVLKLKFLVINSLK